MKIFSIQGFRLFVCLIDIPEAMTCEFDHDITILKVAIFDKVDCIEMEPALHATHQMLNSVEQCCENSKTENFVTTFSNTGVYLTPSFK